MSPILSATALVLTLSACGPKDTPVQAAATPTGLDKGVPSVPAPGAWTPPQPTTRTLDNGMALWVLEQRDLPLVSIRMVVPGGKAADPAGKAGLTSLTDDLLLRGAGDYSAQEFATATDLLAWTFWVGTGSTDSTVSLEGHADRLEPALDLLADALLRPAFAQAELARLVELRQGDLSTDSSDPRTVASWTADRVWFGAGHPLAEPTSGTPDSLEAVSVADVQASWEARRGAGSPTLVVVGDVDADAFAAAIDTRLAQWQASDDAASGLESPAPVQDGPRLTMVDNPGSSQTMLSLYLPAPAQGQPGEDAARLATIALGGTFTSRLNRKLREEKGYTYGAGARFEAEPTYGRIRIGTAVQRDVTAAALTDLLAEVARVHDDLAAEELDKARSSRRTDFVDLAGSRSSLASGYAGLAADALPTSALADELAANTDVDVPSALSAIAPSTLDSGSLVVVGDLAVIRDSVEAALPGEWQELDVWGAAVE